MPPQTLQDTIDTHKDFFMKIPGVVNISPGPDGKTIFRIWVEDEQTQRIAEKLFAKEINGFPVMIQVVYHGKAL